MVTFAEEIINGKLHCLCSECFKNMFGRIWNKQFEFIKNVSMFTENIINRKKKKKKKKKERVYTVTILI